MVNALNTFHLPPNSCGGSHEYEASATAQPTGITVWHHQSLKTVTRSMAENSGEILSIHPSDGSILNPGNGESLL